MDVIKKVRKITEQKLYYAILPFRVWNHLFLCVRSQYESNMCLFCTKIYLRNKKLSRLIKKNLTLDVLKHFPSQLSYGIISGGCVNLFVHSSVTDRQKVFDESANFGTLFYKVINSLFMLLKFCLIFWLGSFSTILASIFCLLYCLVLKIIVENILSVHHQLVLVWKKIRLRKLCLWMPWNFQRNLLNILACVLILIILLMYSIIISEVRILEINI